MRVTWFGHAAFSVEGRNDLGESRKVILDPYNHPLCGGYLPIDEGADVVSVSHENPKYHSDLSAILPGYELLRGLEVPPGGSVARGIRFEARTVFENDRSEGPNAMVRFSLDGIRVLHLGDLGHRVAGESLEFLRGGDVLLALAGGPPTIALDDLVDLILETRPSVVIPMHYLTARVNLKILPVERFLERLAERAPPIAIERLGTSSIELSRESLPRETTVFVLDHAR